jgi:hypothetical protein
MMNEAAGKVVERGQLGSKYLEIPDHQVDEKHLLWLSATFPAAHAIGIAAGANLTASAFAKIWGGGLSGGAAFGLTDQFQREKERSASYPFLNVGDTASSHEKIRSLKQTRAEAGMGYITNFATSLYRDIRNPDSKYSWNRDNYLADTLRALSNPHTYAATAALSVGSVTGAIANRYVTNSVKLASVAIAGDALIVPQWISRKLYLDLGRRMFGRSRQQEIDLESGPHQPEPGRRSLPQETQRNHELSDLTSRSAQASQSNVSHIPPAQERLAQMSTGPTNDSGQERNKSLASERLDELTARAPLPKSGRRLSLP